MQGEAWTAIGAAAVAAIAAVGTTTAAYFASRSQQSRVEAKVDTAADVAAEAASNTRHVSNGFAAKTTTGIDALLAGQERLEDAIQRLAVEHGRTVGRLDHTIERLDKHLDPPAHGARDATTEGD
jgi:hypothetical protein